MIVAHLEKVAFLGKNFGFLAAIRAVVTVYELQIGEEGFTRSAIVTGIRGLIDIALFVDFCKELLYRFDMVVIGGTDEFI
ncbi:hypothetical protein RFZ45_18345, partial [Acinetobacter baumannii]|nr:hypothetical protein [Acinetobacter baumannii]